MREHVDVCVSTRAPSRCVEYLTNRCSPIKYRRHGRISKVRCKSGLEGVFELGELAARRPCAERSIFNQVKAAHNRSAVFVV